MPRRIDVLTLGLSSESRWNPLHRWWARRTVERNLATALKALMARDQHLLDGRVYITPQEWEAASKRSAIAGYDRETDGYWLVFAEDPPPRRLRVLYGERDG